MNGDMGSGLSKEDLIVLGDVLVQSQNGEMDFLSWLEKSVGGVLCFEKALCVYADISAGEVKPRYWLSLGYDEVVLHSFLNSFEWKSRGCLHWWRRNRKAFYLEVDVPPSYASRFEVEELINFGVENVLGHGLINSISKNGTYFSFGNVKGPLGQWHLDVMELLMPTLNSKFFDYICQHMTEPFDPEALPARQREIVRWVVVGLSDKQIADKMQVAEKTIRNQLTEIYRYAKVNSRTQLLAKLR